MSKVNITEAARLVKKTRKTLYNYIHAGKLSKTPDGMIDIAELIRVFGELSPDVLPEDMVYVSKEEQQRYKEMETQIVALKIKLSAAENLCNEKEKHIESLQTAMKLLENRQEASEPAKSKGFFARLFGQ